MHALTARNVSLRTGLRHRGGIHVTDDPQLGRILGDRFRIDELIGRGGMSTVYRGFDTRLHRAVAIKIFQPGADDDARWESEVGLLSQLSHPHLVTLHDAHLEPTDSSNPSYLVMEYVAGASLQKHLAELGPSAPLAALVVAQIGEALASVHGRGIVHRDLKPGNILLEPSDLPPLRLRAKLADFGIAHLLGSDRITRTGTMIGTAAYASPEQVHGQAATAASDIYSLGLVAIETITGGSPFPGTSAETIIARLTRDPEVPASLPAEWTALLESMTARDAALRPTAIVAAMRARELASELDGFALPVAPPAADGTGPTERMLLPTLLLPAAGIALPPADAAATVVSFSSNVPTAKKHSSRTRTILIAATLLAAVILVVVLALLALTHLLSGVPVPTTSPSTSPTISVAPSASPTPSQTSAKPGKGHGKGHGN